MEKKEDMTALVFEFNLKKLAKSKLRGRKSPSGYWKPGGAVGLKQVPVPALVGDDWVIVKTILCGVCGSDMKELTLSGAIDNPLQSFVFFPQIMGHEIVGTVDKVGSRVDRFKKGDRIAISPWFPCKPRGIIPECPRCQQGDYAHCHNFLRGRLPAGMHIGVTPGFGGFAPFVAVHESQCFKIPEDVSFEQAVLADPFSVAFHSCLLLSPTKSQTVLVYGMGPIGLLSIICLKAIFNVNRVFAVARYPFQRDLALKFGAERIFSSNGSKLVEEVAKYLSVDTYKPDKGSLWTIDGVDGVIDTIGSASSIEDSLRFLVSQGRLIINGVSTPERCENTPHYFKELEVIGSNSFSIEEYIGQKAHAFEFFMDFLAKKKINLKSIVTHKFPLEQYQEAFNLLAKKENSNAVKVVFDFNR